MMHTLGVRMGPPGSDDRWIYPSWANPTGQYENPEFTELLHQFLDFDGEEPRWDPRWDHLEDRIREFLPKFVALVRRTESERWGWKQAWSMLILEPLLPSLRDPCFVVVRRDLASVVDSLHRRDGLTQSEAEKVSREIWDRVDAILAAHPEIPAITMDYRAVTRDPLAAARQLADYLGLGSSDEEVRRAAGLVINGPTLRRAIRKWAARDLVTLPTRYGWLLAKDLREGSRFTARHLSVSLPRETYRILRAMT